jgi:signal peptidase II
MANRTILLFLAIFVADQLSKWFVTGPRTAARRRSDQALPIFDLTRVHNHGISLRSPRPDDTHRWLLVAMTAAIAVGVAWWFRGKGTAPARSGDGFGRRALISSIGSGWLYVDFLDLHFGTFRPFMSLMSATRRLRGVVICTTRLPSP